MADLTTVILAAGKGTRMKSSLPKVLHKAGGKAMLAHVLAAAKEAGAVRNIVVVGFGGETVEKALAGEADFVTQEEQLGTGHAVLQAEPLLHEEKGTVLVLCGDTPLLTGKLLKKLAKEHAAAGAKATVLTAVMPDATGYGRIIRAADGTVERIVEHKDATEEERNVREVNSGIYCFEAPDLFAALHEVKNDNAQGEYYLPDVLEILRKKGEKIFAATADDYEETLGVNSRAQLAASEKILRRRKNEALMAEGVTLMDPDTTYVDVDVIVGRDTVIYPGTWLEGATVIGEGCEIGPHSRFQDVKVGAHVTAHFCYAHTFIFAPRRKSLRTSRSAISSRSRTPSSARGRSCRISRTSAIPTSVRASTWAAARSRSITTAGRSSARRSATALSSAATRTSSHPSASVTAPTSEQGRRSRRTSPQAISPSRAPTRRISRAGRTSAKKKWRLLENDEP